METFLTCSVRSFNVGGNFGFNPVRMDQEVSGVVCREAWFGDYHSMERNHGGVPVSPNSERLDWPSLVHFDVLHR